jgi:hypothetical protein
MLLADVTHRLEHMSDLTPVERLSKLRTLEQWLDWQLHDTRRKIRDLEAEASAPVGYVVEKKVRDDHPLGAIVHRADCTMPERETRPISADDARTALAKDAKFFQACEFCAPGKSLGSGG